MASHSHRLWTCWSVWALAFGLMWAVYWAAFLAYYRLVDPLPADPFEPDVCGCFGWMCTGGLAVLSATRWAAERNAPHGELPDPHTRLAITGLGLGLSGPTYLMVKIFARDLFRLELSL